MWRGREGKGGFPDLSIFFDPIKTFFILFRMLGMNATWGVLQEYFLANHTFPNANNQQLTWIGSIGCASVYVAAPMVVLLNSVLGTKLVLSFGLILGSIGFIGGSFATQAWHLYFSLVNHTSRNLAPPKLTTTCKNLAHFLRRRQRRRCATQITSQRVCLYLHLLVFLTTPFSLLLPSFRPSPLEWALVFSTSLHSQPWLSTFTRSAPSLAGSPPRVPASAVRRSRPWWATC